MFGKWVQELRSTPDVRLRLFCIPHAGGGTIAFRRWLPWIPADVAVHAVCLPGREARLRERPMETMPEVVDALSLALEPWLDLPFVIYGHSLGSLIGFEVARSLVALGQSPQRLLVGARAAPDVPLRWSPMAQLPDAEFVALLGERYNGIPKVLLEERELLNLMLPALRADFSIVESYRYQPGPPLTCPITVFGGTRDPTASELELQGWERHTTGAFTRLMVEGEHFFSQNNMPQLLPLIVRELQAALPHRVLSAS